MFTVSVLSDYLYFGSEDETDEYDLNLHEAKYQYFTNRFDLSIGKQIIRWGKTDQISPVDTLNPQDLREFVIPEYEERKIPVWMADLKLFSDDFTHFPRFGRHDDAPVCAGFRRGCVSSWYFVRPGGWFATRASGANRRMRVPFSPSSRGCPRRRAFPRILGRALASFRWERV